MSSLKFLNKFYFFFNFIGTKTLKCFAESLHIVSTVQGLVVFVLYVQCTAWDFIVAIIVVH